MDWFLYDNGLCHERVKKIVDLFEFSLYCSADLQLEILLKIKLHINSFIYNGQTYLKKLTIRTPQDF